ncbi:MAG: dTMP kinase [Phycisphaera sp.]|nr:dTMP kinase [Phycisphaera sp.]
MVLGRPPFPPTMPAMPNADDMQWITRLRGRFVVFDGPDGSGKTTQFRRLANAADAAGVAVTEVREPGGTIIGEQIRHVLLAPEHDMMDMRCEMLLYMASRAQLIAEKIRPAMQRGDLVLADRFISSTLAYQGTAGGLPIADIEHVADVAVGDTQPDLVVVFDVDGKTASGRLNPLLDRIEQRAADYHALVRKGYLDQATEHPDRYRVVDARPDADTVFDALCVALSGFFG